MILGGIRGHKVPLQYAKEASDPDSIFVRITSYNRGPDPATLHVLPQLWFPNTWSWPLEKPPMPHLSGGTKNGIPCVTAKHPTLGKTHLYCMPSPPAIGPDDNFDLESDVETIEPDLLFTENETNFSRLYGGQNTSPFVKDGFHDHIIPSHRPPASDSEPEGFFKTRIRSRVASTYGEQNPNLMEAGPCTPYPADQHFVNPNKEGTKSAAHYTFTDVPSQGCAVVRLKLTPKAPSHEPTLFDEGLFDDSIEARREEADEFYSSLVLGPISPDLQQISRQALAGMLWTKQYYQFIQKDWIEGDPAQPAPPPERKNIRNKVRLDLSPAVQRLTPNYRSGSTYTLLIFCPCPTSECIMVLSLEKR